MFVRAFMHGWMIAGNVRDPFVERDTLAWFLLVEGDAHAQTDLRVDHVAAGLEIGFALLERKPHFGAHWKRHGGVDEAAAGAEVHGAGRKARAGLQLDHFGGGRKHVALGDAALGLLRFLRLAVAVDVSMLFGDGRVHDFPWPTLPSGRFSRRTIEPRNFLWVETFFPKGKVTSRRMPTK